MTLRCLTVIVFAAALGCVSAPALRYYTLDMAPSGTAASHYNIDVDRFRPAEPVARSEIMIAKSATEIEYYAVDTWVANVGTLVAEKLRAEFGTHQPDRPTMVVGGEILRFGQVDTPGGADAQIKLDVWAAPAAARRSDPPVFKKSYELQVPAESAAPGDVVKALSGALESVARDIVEDLNRLD